MILSNRECPNIYHLFSGLYNLREYALDKGLTRFNQLLNLPYLIKRKEYKLHMTYNLIPRKNARHIENF